MNETRVLSLYIYFLWSLLMRKRTLLFSKDDVNHQSSFNDKIS